MTAPGTVARQAVGLPKGRAGPRRRSRPKTQRVRIVGFNAWRDLRPFIAFLNGRGFSGEEGGKFGLSGETEGGDAAARELLLVQRLSFARAGKGGQEALRRLSTRILRDRVRLTTDRVAPAFERYAKEHGLTVDETWTAWREVWHFLQSQDRRLPGSIAECAWCGRFFVRRRRTDENCSTACSVAPLLLGERERREAAARLTTLTDLFASFDKKSREKWGRLDDLFLARSHSLLHLFLMPVRREHEGEFSLPRGESAARSFKVVWDFLFQESPLVAGRVARCLRCGDLYLRADLRMRFCGRDCQISQYRKKSSARRRAAERVTERTRASTGGLLSKSRRPG